MDLKGSLIDTNVKIYPSNKLLEFINKINLTQEFNVPENIVKLKDEKKKENSLETLENENSARVYLNNEDVKNFEYIRKYVLQNFKDVDIDNVLRNTETPEIDINLSSEIEQDESVIESSSSEDGSIGEINDCTQDKDNNSKQKREIKKTKVEKISEKPYLLTSDINWIYEYLHQKMEAGVKDIPYLHNLLEGSLIVLPKNKLIKRNPELEARCVKLRAQQEAREYRNMTKGVDNVRIRYPEDNIAYQLKSMNRQLIAIGQFIISIFAGFLFGFRGVEWMVGNLDFGFRLLLGVMCALIIALAEIYFLAKKLNEELQLTETIQIGGPPKFADPPLRKFHDPKELEKVLKEHED